MYDSSGQILVGVDGGGSGCRVAIANGAAVILALAKGGRANATTDLDQTIKNVTVAIDAAAQKAGIGQDALNAASAHFGLAGMQNQTDANRIASAFSFAGCTVTDDRPTTVSGALGGKDGFLISVGTGTIVARSLSGQSRFIGGWGFYVSDQASGAWLGRGALDRTLQCYDKMARHSDLSRNLLSQFGDDPNQIVTFSVDAKPGDFAGFAPDIIKAAQAADENARDLMKQGAAYLGRALTVLGFQPGDALCLAGGVGPHYQPYLVEKTTRNIVKPKGSALDGALYLAARAASVRKGGKQR